MRHTSAPRLCAVNLLEARWGESCPGCAGAGFLPEKAGDIVGCSPLGKVTGLATCHLPRSQEKWWGLGHSKLHIHNPEPVSSYFLWGSHLKRQL